MDTQAATPKFLTVRQWAETHSFPTVLGLRHLIFHADANGFPVRRLGRRVLLEESEVLGWLLETTKVS